MAAIHWSGSKSEGLKVSGDAVPSPHSRSRKVLVEKWRMTPNSRSCQADCQGAGRMSAEAVWAGADWARRRARARKRGFMGRPWVGFSGLAS